MSLASRITGGGSPEEARRVGEADATRVGAGGGLSAEGSDGVASADPAVATDVVAGADPAAEEDPAAAADPMRASASRGDRVAAEGADGRVNPGGVSGANPGVCDADDSSAGAVAEIESVPDADRDDEIAVESGVDAGRVAARE